MSHAPEVASGPAQFDETRPEVAVIIPVGRVDDELADQLAALEASSCSRPWEVILSVNTADADHWRSLERWVAGHQRVRLVDSADRRSASHARNVGARSTMARILLFCDGDDLVSPAWVEVLSSAVGPGVAVGGHLDEERLAVPGQQHWRPPATPGRLPTFLGHDFLVSANMGLERAAFEQAGGFDETLIRGEDLALSFQLALAGVELRYVPGAVVHYRHRRGLWPMLRQHYLYGRGMSQVVRAGHLPEDAARGMAALKPSGNQVPRRSWQSMARRSAIGAGRVVGLTVDRFRPDPGCRPLRPSARASSRMQGDVAA